MLKIATRLDPTGPVTLALVGCLSEDHLAELETILAKARRTHKQIRIDLSEITLVDRHSLQFLVAQKRQDIELINCPEYIEPWIYREASNELSN
jgi:ABC-type transporter Mla MlaB component